jgi:hypothetical protein
MPSIVVYPIDEILNLMHKSVATHASNYQ